MNQAHPDDLVHIRLRELITDPVSHQGDPPAVLGDALMPASGGIAMPGCVLQSLRRMESLKQGCSFHVYFRPFLFLV